MFKYLFFIAATLFFCNPSQARVRFIMDTGAASHGNTPAPSYEIDNGALCIEEGYNKTACGNGYILRHACPYSLEYYAACCPEEYAFTPDGCEAMGKTVSENSCSGYYKCRDIPQTPPVAE